MTFGASSWDTVMLIDPLLLQKDSLRPIRRIAHDNTRISIISTSPEFTPLDPYWTKWIEQHSWPAGEYSRFRANNISAEDAAKQFLSSSGIINDTSSPMAMVINCHMQTIHPGTSYSHEEQYQQALFYACAHTAHEISHMLGIHHCTSYACVMQEGFLPNTFLNSPPPFLCPLDVQKLVHSLHDTRPNGLGVSKTRETYILERNQAILAYCTGQSGAGFQAYVNWLECLIQEGT